MLDKKRLVSLFAAVACSVSPVLAGEVAEGTWRCSEATDADNPYGVRCITDGNWWLKVADWSNSLFSFSGQASAWCKAGSGKLDFAKAEADLKRSWGFYNSRPLQGMTTMTEFVFPARCDKLCSYGFSGCTSLEKISGGGAFTSIPDHWVNGCANLTTIELDFTHVTSIDSVAFNGCQVERLEFPSITEITKNYPFTSINGGSTGVRELYMPALTNVTGKGLCYGCLKLETVVLSSNIVNLGEDAFRNCKALRRVTPSRFYAYGISGGFMREAATNYTETVTLYGDDPSKDGSAFGLLFYVSGVPKVDMTYVMQNVTIKQSFSSATRLEELWLGPCMTNLSDQGGSTMFPSTLRRIYFTGYAPLVMGRFFENNTKVPNYQVRTYVDPKFDKSWKVGNLSRSRALTTDEIALLNTSGYEDVKAEYEKGNLLGTWQYALYSPRLWLIQFHSPHRKYRGLSVIVR